jgi:hypothetical protein
VSITTPANGATYPLLQRLHSNFTCTEGTNGPGIASCVDQNGHPSGALLNTQQVGTYTFTVTATSKDGMTTTVSDTYRVKLEGFSLICLIFSYFGPPPGCAIGF